MGGETPHESVWRLARRQHGVITRAQLLRLGYTRHAIQHRLSTGRLHAIHRGVFVVGRPELDVPGRCLAAVLACGPTALISHQTAGELWGIRARGGRPIEVSVPAGATRAVQGIRLHRRRSLGDRDRAVHRGIPVTSPIRTLADLATRLTEPHLEAAVNEADPPHRFRTRAAISSARQLDGPADAGNWSRGQRLPRGLLLARVRARDRRTVCVITARRHSRPGIVAGIRSMPRRE
jgi:hypothetical protein